MRAQTDLVAAFAKASREGRMEDLLRLLDPEVTLTLDPTALPPGMSGVIRGADIVAARARVGAGSAAAEVMLVDGTPGLVVIATNGTVERILAVTIAESQITAIDVVSDPARLVRIDLRLLTWWGN